MGLFDSLAKQSAQPAGQTVNQPMGQPVGQNQQMEAMRNEVNVLRNDPAAYLSQRGYNIPAGMIDPKEITVHLLKTGQVAAGRLQQIFGMTGGK